MSTPPEDFDALFGAAAEPAPVFPAPAPNIGADARKESRVKVSWPARVQTPNGRVVELRVRDLSEGGVGLLCDVSIPANTVLNFAVGVPGFNDPAKIVPISGTIKTTYMVLQGRDICCGGTWVTLPEESRELLGKWIRRLRK